RDPAAQLFALLERRGVDEDVPRSLVAGVGVVDDHLYLVAGHVDDTEVSNFVTEWSRGFVWQAGDFGWRRRFGSGRPIARRRGGGAAGRSPELDELAPERPGVPTELDQLPAKARRLVPESVVALLRRFHPAVLAQPILDDLRDDASNHLPALVEPSAHAAEIVEARPRLLGARRRPASVAWLGRRERHGHAEWAEERPAAARSRRLRVSATF